MIRSTNNDRKQAQSGGTGAYKIPDDESDENFLSLDIQKPKPKKQDHALVVDRRPHTAPARKKSTTCNTDHKTRPSWSDEEDEFIKRSLNRRY